MKKNLLLLCLTVLAITVMPSCMKEDLPNKKHETKYESQIITVELKKNQTYHYTLPQNLSGRPFKITSQAGHFSVSEIGADKIYTYTPAYNYVGNDRVVIANSEEHDNNNCGNNNNNNCGNNNGGNGNYHNPDGNNNNGCNHDQDTKVEQTITINFIIKEKEGKNFRGTICPAF